MDVGPACERLEQRPFGRGQVLEPVRVDRLAVPGSELGLQALDRPAADEIAIPQDEAVELCVVGGVERGQVAGQVIGIEQPGFELAQRVQKRVGEPAGAGGAREAVQGDVAQRPPHDERALGGGDDGTRPRIAGRELPEQIVEGADRATEQAATACEQVALHPVDVRPVRHDQNRLVVQARQIALEQERDLAGMRRPCEKGESHLPIVERPQDGPGGRSTRFFRSLRYERLRLSGGGLRPAATPGGRTAGHLAGAGVAQIRDLRPATRVRIRHAQSRTLRLIDLFPATVTNEHCFPGQFRLLR